MFSPDEGCIKMLPKFNKFDRVTVTVYKKSLTECHCELDMKKPVSDSICARALKD